MASPLKYPWDSSAFVQKSPITDFSQPLDFSTPAAFDMNGLMGTAAKYGPTPSFIPGTPVGDTYSQMGGDIFMPAAIPRPTTSSSWFGDTFSGVDSTMKAFGQKMQDWGVTGGKDANGNAFNGWGGLAFGAAQGIANWMGARDTYALQKKSVDASIANANENMRINKSRLNDDLESRQIARVASNPGAYQSVGDYMKVNRV